MNSKSVQSLRVPSLLLAAALQVMPIVRAALPAAQAAGNIIVIIFRWAAGAAAALGSIQAVSGASTAITSPSNVNATNGQPFSLRLTTAPDPAHYWAANGLPSGLSLVGTNGYTAWRIMGTPTVSGVYSVGLTAKDQSNSGASRTVTATLTINIASAGAPPSVSTQPASLTVTQGQSATFTVTATGPAPLRYQWRFQGASLSGRTNSTLTLNPALAANAGNYDVIVNNNSGSVTSQAATLTVLVPPTISTQPASLTVAQNQNAAFSVAASGTAPLNYQWRFQGNNLSGQTSSTLNLGAVTTPNAGNYDVIVANNVGSVTSQVATLTVVIPPNITTPPASLTITQGQDANFTVAADGTAPLTYFWRKGTAVISRSVNPSFSITNAQPADNGSYSVIASNFAGTATSAAATLAVVPTPQPPFVSTPPTNRAVVAGSPTTFTVVAGGTTPLQYQWHFNNAPVPGQTGQSYTLPSVQAADVGPYFVVVSNDYGSISSAVANLSLIAPPQITADPQSRTNLTGSTATFTVATTSTVPVGYQWRRNGANLSNGARISGAQGSTLSITGLLTNDAGNFTVVVTNVAGAVTSQVAVLTVVAPPPVLAPLVVQIIGSGTVSPNYHGQLLQVGNGYTMTASPAAGHLFSGWSGGIASSTPSLTFTMQSNLVLRASFIPATATFVKGTYTGLFYDPAGVFHFSSGSVTVQTTAAGKFSASLVTLGRKYSWTGRFNSTGHATNSVKRGLLSTLTVELALNNADPDEISGRVTDGSWFAQLLADRAVFDKKLRPASQAGTYTFLIPGNPAATDTPGGDGIATATVDAAGRVKLKGTLADGSKVTQSATISKNGDWPLYVSLYSGGGELLSWQLFTNRAGDDISGLLSWVRSQQPSAVYYPLGFDVETGALGSRYQPPVAGAKVLNFTNGRFRLTGGNLPQNLTNQIVLDTANKVTTSVGGPLTLSLTVKSGLFKGSMVNPATGKAIPFNGVVFQKRNCGWGFFLGLNQSGAAYLGP